MTMPLISLSNSGKESKTSAVAVAPSSSSSASSSAAAKANTASVVVGRSNEIATANTTTSPPTPILPPPPQPQPTRNFEEKLKASLTMGVVNGSGNRASTTSTTTTTTTTASAPTPLQPPPPPSTTTPPPPPNDDELQELFDEIDLDRDGKLSRKDVEDTMFQRKAKALNLKPTIVFRAFQKADVHSQGWVERSEFGAFIQLIAYFHHLYQVFTFLDTDHDRHLTKSEFVQAATLLQLPNPEQVFDEITSEHYLGYIVFDDFCWYMAEHHVQVHPPTAVTLQAAEQERPQGAAALAASSVTFSFASSSSSSMASGKSP